MVPASSAAESGSGYTPTSYSPDGKLLTAWHETASFGPRSDTAVLDATDGSAVDPLDQWITATWRTDRALIGAGVTSGPDVTVETYDLDSHTTSSTDVKLPWREIGTIFESKHRLWIELRENFFGDSASEVWTIDKDSMQRTRPTMIVKGFNSGSGSDDGIACGDFRG